MLRPRNWLIVLVALLLLPFLNISIVSSFIATIALPEAVLNTLLVHRPIALAVAAGLVLLCALLLRWIYSFHYFLLEGRSFLQAIRASARLGRGCHIRDFLAFLLLQTGFSVLFLLLTLLLIAVIYWITALFASSTLLGAILTAAVWIVLGILLLIFTVLSAPLSFCCISVLYYLHKQEKQEPILCRALRRPAGRTAPDSFGPSKLQWFLSRLSLFHLCLPGGQRQRQLQHRVSAHHRGDRAPRRIVGLSGEYAARFFRRGGAGRRLD